MRDRTRTLLLGLLACGPFVAAVVADVTVTETSQITGGKIVPALGFRQYAVSLGEVRPYPVIEVHYEFQNSGSQTITIDQVKPSCGCLRWHMHREKMVYAPGESGRLTVRMFTANESAGPHEFAIDVDWSDDQPHHETLTFRVVLPEKKVSVEPREVFFYQNHGRADKRTIYVTDYRHQDSRPMTVLSAEATSETIRVDLLPSEKDAAGRLRTPIQISVPGQVRPGREIAYVKITTDDKEFPSIMVPVLIEGGTRMTGPALPDQGVPNVWEIARRELGLPVR